MAETLQHQETTQCIGLPPTGSRNHHRNAKQPNHALTINLDQSDQAAQRRLWEARRAQAADIAASAKRQIKAVDVEIERLVDRIVAASNDTLIARYEHKIGQLEQDKARLTENLVQQSEPKGAFEEKLEPALTFLSNPWKLWESGNIHLRRLVLKLAFTTPIRCCRINGARTPKIALPFKALGGNSDPKVCCGGVGET